MKEIAYIPLTPLGDVMCCINQLEHLKKIYAPCRITVFAIPLIADLLKNSVWVDTVITLKGDIRGTVDLADFIPPDTEFDAVFNLAYHIGYVELQKKLKCRMRYGSECYNITKEVCRENFDQWVSVEYWDTVTEKKYRSVCAQMAEPIRLVDQDFSFDFPTLSPETYRIEHYPGKLPQKYVLFLPGTSALIKYWPISKYLAAARAVQESGLDVVFSIGPQDRRLVPDLEKSGFPVLDTLPFAQLADVVTRAELVVGNDSGPMHFASSFHHPTIHLIATSSAFNWYSYKEPVHSLIMPECGSEETCNNCTKSCIGKISVTKVVEKIFEKLNRPLPKIRQVAFMVQDRIGDSSVNICSIEEACKFYAPCEITVFCGTLMKNFYEAYAFADHIIEFKGKDTALPQVEYDAVFNYRYEKESVELLSRMKYKTAYGYEQVEIPENVCRRVFTKYLPLTLWDDVQLRRYTSVTEQGASLMRLVNPDYHCRYITLAENTLKIDFTGIAQFRKNLCLIAPGASAKYKDWGKENFIRLAEDVKKNGRRPLFILGPQEEDYMESLQKSGLEFLYCAEFPQIAGLALFYNSCAVGNDTGIMHLIRACGCRSVTICFEDTHLTWAPYPQDRHTVIHALCADYEVCVKCKDRNCRKDFTYDRIWNAVSESLLHKQS